MTGERITQVNDYPLGTVAEHPNGSRVVRAYAGWVDTGGSEYLQSVLVRDSYTLIELGTEPFRDTLDQYKQRFRTTVIGGALGGGVSIRPVMEALRTLDVPDYPLSPGMYVAAYDRDLCATLPPRTVIQIGVPDKWQHYGLFHYRDQNWYHLTGHATYFYGVGKVVEMPGVEEQEWVQQEWTEEEEARVEEFRARAWDIGRKAKATQQWCHSYEYTMERVDITDAWVNRPRPMTREQVNALPAGSHLYWEDLVSKAVFERVDDAENPNDWNIRQVWSSTGRTIVPREGDTMTTMLATRASSEGWHPPTVPFIEELPVGTVINIDGYNRTKKSDGLWHHRPYRLDSGGYPADQLSQEASRCRILRIGDGSWDYGTEMDAAQQAAKPEGSVFYWQGNGLWALFIRDAAATNDAATRKLVGTSDSDWNTTATYLGPMGAVPISEMEMLEVLPNGSKVRYGPGIYERVRGLWRSTPGDQYGNADRDFARSVRNGEVEMVECGDPNQPEPRTEQRLITDMRQLYDAPQGTRFTHVRSGDRLVKRRHGVLNETTGGYRSVEQCWRSVEARTLMADWPVE